jgi:hypothetical protein
VAVALASGRAHGADFHGGRPLQALAWGWRDGLPQGRRIGWVENSNLYLSPEAGFAAAQEMARDMGEALPVSARTLWRRLREQGRLVGTRLECGTPSAGLWVASPSARSFIFVLILYSGPDRPYRPRRIFQRRKPLRSIMLRPITRWTVPGRPRR